MGTSRTVVGREGQAKGAAKGVESSGTKTRTKEARRNTATGKPMQRTTPESGERIKAEEHVEKWPLKFAEGGQSGNKRDNIYNVLASCQKHNLVDSYPFSYCDFLQTFFEIRPLFPPL
jgi:hypothetical protein